MNEENWKILLLGILLGAFLVFFVFKANHLNDVGDKKMIELKIPEQHIPRSFFNDFYIQPLINGEVKQEIQITC